MENILLDWTLGTRPRKVRGSPRAAAVDLGDGIVRVSAEARVI